MFLRLLNIFLMNIFCTTAYFSVGPTFLNWSIHYLSGQERFYHDDSSSWIELTTNPVSSAEGVVNAHGHLKNHPAGAKNIDRVIKKLLSLDTRDLLSFCAFSINLAELISLPEEEVRNKVYKDYINGLSLCNKSNIPLIYIHTDAAALPQLWNVRTLTNSTEENVRKKFYSLYFNETDEDRKLPIWDLRELRALNIRPYDDSYLINPRFEYSHLWVNAQDLWTITEDVLEDCFDYLNLKINSQKFKQWIPIAHKWQKQMNHNMKFSREVDHIIDYAISGHSYNISHLTFDQEIIIQHLLIYKHNLNIKNWNLSKFPDNTRELHHLLEPNTHVVEKIY